MGPGSGRGKRKPGSLMTVKNKDKDAQFIQSHGNHSKHGASGIVGAL